MADTETDTILRQRAARDIIAALECQPGLDTLPAQASLPRILTGIFKITGHKFKLVGHGRMRDVFEVLSPDGEDLSLVLKLGNKQATARDIALTLAFPEDRAAIYAASDYGVVVERVERFTQKFNSHEEFAAFLLERFGERYIGVGPEDLGTASNGRTVMIGSSTRVVRKDAAVKGSASQQQRAE